MWPHIPTPESIKKLLPRDTYNFIAAAIAVVLSIAVLCKGYEVFISGIWAAFIAVLVSWLAVSANNLHRAWKDPQVRATIGEQVLGSQLIQLAVVTCLWFILMVILCAVQYTVLTAAS